MKWPSWTTAPRPVVMSLIFAMLMIGTGLPHAAQFNPRMKLMARRAAKVDALRNLTEQIYGLQLDTTTTVRNFIVGSDVIRSRLLVAVRGAREVDYQELKDGTAEVTVEITLGTVETILGRQIQYNQEIIEAVGYGVPPGMSTSQGDVTSASGIRAIGYGLAPNEPGLIGTEKDLLGFRAARNDALRNLAEKIDRIQVTAKSTVRDFSVQNDDIRTKVNSILNGARIISENKLADSRYQVELEADTAPLQTLQRR